MSESSPPLPILRICGRCGTEFHTDGTEFKNDGVFRCPACGHESSDLQTRPLEPDHP